jgi:hypothetical protein
VGLAAAVAVLTAAALSLGASTPKPDLIVSKLSAPPAALKVGDTFKARDTTKNRGKRPAGRSTNRYYLSLDAKKSKADVRLSGKRGVKGLAPGKASGGRATLTVPQVAAGSYFLLACADDRKKVKESNERNNCRASKTVAKVTGREPPNAPANRSPSAAAQSVTTASGVPVAVTLSGSDPDGDTLTYTTGPAPASGALSGTAPNVTYTPTTGFAGADSFGFIVADGRGGSASATVSITVTPPASANGAPAAAGDSATVLEDAAATAVPVLANDTDAEGDAITISSASDPANGAVVLTDGLPGAHTGLTYQPDPNYCNATPDTFTYTLNGGSTATVSMTVTCVDDVPVAANDSATVLEDAGAAAVPVLGNDTDSDGGPKTISSASDPANGAVVLTGGSAGARTGLTYQPDPNYCNAPPGTALDTFTYTLNGGSNATVSMTVTCVDETDEPPVAVDDSAVVLEDAVATAVAVLDNDADPDGGPKTISEAEDPPNGTVVLTGGSPGAHTGLTYQPDPAYCNDQTGTPDTFMYVVNGDSKATVSMTVTCVDDVPVAVNDSATVLEDAGAAAVPVLGNDTDSDGGPKTISSASDPANGAVVLTGGSAGARTGLTYQPDPNYCNVPPGGTPDTFSYTLNGGSNATVSMTVTCVNDAPVADPDSYSGGNHGIRMRVGTTHADAHEVEVSGSVLQGDTDVDTPVGNLTVTPGAITTTDCAAASPACANNVIMGSDGTFTYDPPAGGDTSDTFTYTVEDNDTGDSDGTEDTHTNTVTIGMSGTRAWFVDDSAPAGGRGVSHAPLQSLAQLATGGNLNEEDGTGDRVFVYSGTYTSGLDLESGQHLLGEPHGLNIGGTQFVAAGGTRPALSAAAPNANVVALGLNNELQDLALGSTSGTGASLTGGSVGTFTARDTTIDNVTGKAMEITAGGTVDAIFPSVSSAGSSTSGVSLTGLSGTLTMSAGAISNAAGTDFHVSGGNAAITYGGTITDATGRLVNVDGTSGGSRTFNGAVSDTTDNDNGSTGVRINSAGGTNSFAGGLRLSTGSADALEIQNSPGGTTVPSNTVNTLKSTSGYALKVLGSTIGSGLTFQRIDSTGGTTNAGINLDTVSGGGVTVTGNGTAATGGTISSKQGADGDDGGVGISLNAVSAPVSFSRMQLNDFSNYAIKGTGVSGGFSLVDSTVNGTNGNNDTLDESSIALAQLSGAGDITRTNVSGGHEDNIQVVNTSGTLNRLRVSGPATLGPVATATGNDAINIAASGGIFNATVENMTLTSARGEQIAHSISGNTASDLVVSGNTVTNNHPNVALGRGGVSVVAGGSADVTYSITNNSIKGAKGTALAVSKTFGGLPGDATMFGLITGNTIGQAGVVNSGSIEGSGIAASLLGKGVHTSAIRSNSIYGYSNHGIALLAQGAGTSTTGLPIHDGDGNFTLTGNLVSTPNAPAGGLAQNGVHLNSGSNGAGGGDVNDAYDICLDLGSSSVAANKNSVVGSGALGGTEIRLRQRFAADILMPGYTGTATDTVAVQNYVLARNTTSASSAIAGYQGPGGGFFNTAGGGPCPQP